MPLQTTLQEVLHEPHADAREKVMFALDESTYPAHQRSAGRMASCCTTARFYVDRQEGKVAPWLARCRHRLCPFCGRRRSRQVSAQILDLLKQMTKPRLIVLTVKSNNKPLRDQLRDLRQWFSKLRRQPFWKTAVHGGVYTLEITRNETTGQWHPHLNIIYDGSYLPHRQLQYHWHQITKHSEIVWISAVTDRPGAANEVAKYVGKIQNVAQLPDNAIREYATGASGMRFVQTFGTTWNKTVKDKDEGDEQPRDEYQVSLPHIMHVAANGHQTALNLAVAIAQRFPTYASYIYHQMPQLQPDLGKARRQLQALARLRGQPPPRPPPGEHSRNDEELDRALFCSFNRFRLEAEAGTYGF